MGEVKNITAVNTEVELCGIKMDNPVMAASGTFGYGYEFAELYDINCLGSFSFKGTTLKPRFGNPTPRIAECEMGMINAIGLQNPGVDKVIEEELPKLSKCLHKKVMANIGGFSIEEYTEVAKRLDVCDQIGWLELNISCPNVRHGGLAFGTDPDAAASVVSSVKKAVKKPVIVKLSPNVTDITAIAKACEAAGADGLSLINTMLGMSDTCSAGAHQDLGVRIFPFYRICDGIFHHVPYFRCCEYQSVVTVYRTFDAAGPCERLVRSEKNCFYIEQCFCYLSFYI